MKSFKIEKHQAFRSELMLEKVERRQDYQYSQVDGFPDLELTLSEFDRLLSGVVPSLRSSTIRDFHEAKYNYALLAGSRCSSSGEKAVYACKDVLTDLSVYPFILGCACTLEKACFVHESISLVGQPANERGTSRKAVVHATTEESEDEKYWNWFFSDEVFQHQPIEVQNQETCVTSTTLPKDVGPKVFSYPVKHTSSEETSSEGSPRTRKVKPVPSRFRGSSKVSVHPSSIQCLSVVLDYHGYTGNILKVVLNNSITNTASSEHDSKAQAGLCKTLLSETRNVEHGVECFGHGHGEISAMSGVLQRIVYVRDISSIFNSVSLITYQVSPKFHIDNPYELQYFRFELDPLGRLINESKCGLCPFCPKVKFLPFKNSSYLSHLTLEHGVFANSFVVPEGMYYGQYHVAKLMDSVKPRVVKALQCPACFQVVEVACWKNKANPLLSYFRHFKKHHLSLTRTFVESSIDPVTLRTR